MQRTKKPPVFFSTSGRSRGCARFKETAVGVLHLPLQRTVSRGYASPSQSLGAPTRCRADRSSLLGTTARRCSCADRGRGPGAHLCARPSRRGPNQRRHCNTAGGSAPTRARRTRGADHRFGQGDCRSARVTASRSRRACARQADRGGGETRALTWCIERWGGGGGEDSVRRGNDREPVGTTFDNE